GGVHAQEDRLRHRDRIRPRGACSEGQVPVGGWHMRERRGGCSRRNGSIAMVLCHFGRTPARRRKMIRGRSSPPKESPPLRGPFPRSVDFFPNYFIIRPTSQSVVLSDLSFGADLSGGAQKEEDHDADQP